MNRIQSFADIFHRNGHAMPPAVNNFLQALTNAYTLRTDLARRFTGSGRKRDLLRECDLPYSPVTPQTYQDLFERNAIAHRIVTLWPRECWQIQPTVYEVEDARQITEFEKAWDAIGKGLRGQSYFRQEEGSPVWDYLRRLDELSRIGQYGVLLYGFDDGRPLYEQLSGIDERGSFPGESITDKKGRFTSTWDGSTSYTMNAAPQPGRRLLYLRVFPETLAQITRWESNPYSPRYGQPVAYQIDFNDPENVSSGIGQPTGSREVHWTRILHVADNRTSNEVLGQPAIQPSLNHVLSVEKVYMADAEAMWLNTFLKVFFESIVGGGIDIDETQFRHAMEKMFSGAQPWGVLDGLAAKPVAPAAVDPTAHIVIHLQAIAIQQEVAMRIFMGSERGELASREDTIRHNKKVNGRNMRHVTPNIIVPFVDRLIMAGCLPEPTADGKVTMNAGTKQAKSYDTGTGYCIDWPSLDIQTDEEQADMATKRTQAMSVYVSGGVSSLMAPMDFLTRELGYDEEEATAIIKSAEKEKVKRDEEAKKQAQEMQASGQPVQQVQTPSPAAGTTQTPAKANQPTGAAAGR